MLIGLCTDSNSQLPSELAERYGVEVVPLTVMIDDHEYLDGVDLDADAFYELFADGRRPAAEFSKPSAGQFAAAYDVLAERGCTQILSIHTSVQIPSHAPIDACSILQAARLAVHSSPVPVRLIDSGTSRFGVSCCVWAAGDALAAGATFDEAAAVAESLAPAIGTVFVVGGLDLVVAGRAHVQRSVLSLVDGEPTVLERVDSMCDAVAAMTRYALEWGAGLQVAIGTAHRDVWPFAAALGRSIGESAAVREVVHFRIGPSVGVDTGPGAVSCVLYPT